MGAGDGIWRPFAVFIGASAFLFVANQLIGASDPTSDFLKSLVGGAVAGGVAVVYLPLRRRIKAAIKSEKPEEGE